LRSLPFFLTHSESHIFDCSLSAKLIKFFVNFCPADAGAIEKLREEMRRQMMEQMQKRQKP
jgi:hypothetical protein